MECGNSFGIRSIDMENNIIIQPHPLDSTENTVIKSTINLCQNGITLMCIACNTTQYYKNKVEEICNLYNVKFVFIPDVINSYLEENHINEFDLLGISHVFDFQKYSAFIDLNNKYTISKPTTDFLRKIELIAYYVKENKIDRAANFLRDLLKKETMYNTVIVALTEISKILSIHTNLGQDKLVIDSLQLLVILPKPMWMDFLKLFTLIKTKIL